MGGLPISQGALHNSKIEWFSFGFGLALPEFKGKQYHKTTRKQEGLIIGINTKMTRFSQNKYRNDPPRKINTEMTRLFLTCSRKRVLKVEKTSVSFREKSRTFVQRPMVAQRAFRRSKSFSTHCHSIEWCEGCERRSSGAAWTRRTYKSLRCGQVFRSDHTSLSAEVSVRLRT